MVIIIIIIIIIVKIQIKPSETLCEKINPMKTPKIIIFIIAISVKTNSWLMYVR